MPNIKCRKYCVGLNIANFVGCPAYKPLACLHINPKSFTKSHISSGAYSFIHGAIAFHPFLDVSVQPHHFEGEMR